MGKKGGGVGNGRVGRWGGGGGERRGTYRFKLSRDRREGIQTD